MSLHLALQAVPSTVLRHERSYQAARATEPSFAPYATATALLDGLSPKSALTIAERQVLAVALVRHHQASRHPLWQAVLLVAFEPMLRRLRGNDRSEDRDQSVLVAFLQALAKLPLSDQPVFIALRRATARELSGVLRREDVRADVPFEDDSSQGMALPHADAQPYVACLAGELVNRLVKRRGGEDVARLLAGVETVTEQADRLAAAAPECGPKPPSADTLEKRRLRAIAELRAELHAPSRNKGPVSRPSTVAKKRRSPSSDA